MGTTTHYSRLVAGVLATGSALVLGASVSLASPHAPKPVLDYPSPTAADAITGIRHVQISDPAHMALIENARHHGLNVHDIAPIGSSGRRGELSASATTSKALSRDGGPTWTYPGVLAGLSLGFVLLAGGIVLVARRLKSRTMTV